MQLSRRQFVVFEDGHMEGYLEARWSERNEAFYSFSDDGTKIYSTTIIEKPKGNRKFTPSAKTCTVEIHPCGQTDKAYVVYDGFNGSVIKPKTYYKHIAKSICYENDGKIFAPIWA